MVVCLTEKTEPTETFMSNDINISDSLYYTRALGTKLYCVKIQVQFNEVTDIPLPVLFQGANYKVET